MSAEGDMIHMVEFPPFFTRAVTFLLPICIPAHQAASENANASTFN